MQKNTLLIRASLTLVFLLTTFLGFAQSSQTFNSPGTYTFTVPPSVISITVEVWGAGGAGGGATASKAAGGGGAGGGYVRRVAMSVVPGATYTLNVGAGGNGAKTIGSSGQPSWFSSAATIYAVGGNGGDLGNISNTAASGASALSTGNIGFTAPFSYYGGAGGQGTSGSPSSSGGGGGSSAGTNSNGAAPIGLNGGIAPLGGGNGADGSTNNGNGANGLTPGGGGAGAVRSNNKDKSGGNGANGQVIVSWSCPVYSLNSPTTVAATCTAYPAIATVNGTATGLPTGTYTVTYNLTGTNTATAITATMIVTTAGTGTFTTSTLANSGSTTITITNIATPTCGNVITTNNTATTTVAVTPTITSTTPGVRSGAGTVTLIAAASAGNVSWFSSAIGGAPLFTGTNYITLSISVTTSYWVQANNGSCSSSPRVEVIAIIDNAEIAVSGNGINITDGDTTPSLTDDTNLGGTNLLVPLVKTFTINNFGGTPLTIGTLTKTGTNAAEFVVSTLPPSIPAQSSATFTISFIPNGAGNRTANLSFVTNDGDENPFNFDIAGTGLTGVTPEINLRGLGVDIVDGASAGYTTNDTDFGNSLIGVAVVKTFTIQNTGTGPLTLTGVPKVTITGDAVFTVTAQPSTTIAAGGSTTFQVSFNSAITGNFLAVVNIASDDLTESIYDFVVTATASVSGVEIDIQGNDISIVSGDTTPSTLDQTDFGTTDTTTAISIPYQIYSYGSSNLTLTTTVTVTALTGTGFNASVIVNGTLPWWSGTKWESVTSFNVTFTPTATVGIRTARITVNSNDPNESPYTFIVQADVKNPTALTVAPGGVISNLKYWIKADSNIGTVASDADIITWQDNTTGSTKNAIAKLGKEPKFLNDATNNVNFNPVIKFNGANTMAGGQGFNILDMFIVVKPTKRVTSSFGWYDIYCGDDTANNKPAQDVTGFEMGDTSNRHLNEVLAYNQGPQSSYGVAEISTSKSYAGVNIFNPRNHTTRMSIFNNGGTLNNGNGALATTEVLTGTYKNIINSRYWLGASETFGPSYDGDILEVINYSIANSLTDRRRIESYLAIKYGITLGINGASLDYYNSASTNTATSIYKAGEGFNYNIAGIGRDDASQLNQKQSKTENTNNDITIGLTDIYAKNSDNPNTFVSDRNFLVWGSDNASLLPKAPVLVNMSSGITPALTSQVDFISIRRTWRVVETGGNVPSVKVSIPSTMLTSTITPPGDFLMFVSDSPVFNPTSEYRIMRVNGSKLETDFDFDGIKYVTFGYAPERTFQRCIEFDGVNDYLDSGKVLDLNTSFTVSAWVKSNAINKTILSKRNNTFTAGYDLSINSSGKAEMSWMNGTKQSIVSTMVIPQRIWHNIAVTYDGTTAKLYIDGVEDASINLLNVPANPTQSFLIAAADGLIGNTTSFFRGGIDEVRVWNVALTEKQLRYVMNQEILSNGLLTNGSIIPNTITLNDIKIIPWANLSAYYPMSTYTFTNAKDISKNNFTAALRNLTTVDRQTAPLPYETANDGPWQTPSTWLNNTVQDLPNSVSLADDLINVDWNIVRTSHNVSSTGNKTVLGLMVNSQTITASNDTKIEVTNYLDLDGKIDLVGMSQLVQTLDSDLDITSSGSIERDQKGQANFYNYNYWCSPVSPINSIANNTNYTVAGVMKDGTLSTPANINWIAGYNALITIPISVARFWLYKFDNYANSYSNWVKIDESSALRVGQGFTMKGSGAEGTQNYTFVGKPNNGLINSNTILPDQLILTGNPYPSAMDAEAFINDNAGSIDRATDGTLYFWEHYSSNNTHVLKDYQGGYGVKNLVGGIAPVSSDVDFISQSGTTSKSDPKRYIPVGQGFFVNGKIGSGGTIIFNNNQRAFFKETDAINSNSLYKQRPSASKPAIMDHWNNNSNDIAPKNTYKKVRLGFNSSNNYHRQVLLGFMNEKATSKMDYGYDGISLDDIPNDMYFLNGENQLVIQGEGYFDENSSYPIGVKTAVEGKVSFRIDALDNISEEQKIYIYDDDTKIYNEIQKNSFEVNMPVGINNTRFSLRFKDKSMITDKTLSVTENNTNTDGITIAYIQNSNTIKINNNWKETTVEKVTLFNINGQTIASWKIENQDQQNIQIPVNSISSGVYVAKLTTTTGELSKKLIIK